MTETPRTVEMPAVCLPPVPTNAETGETYDAHVYPEPGEVPCPTCGAFGDAPCMIGGTNPRPRQHPHVARAAAQPSPAPEIPAEDYAAVWRELTTVQADSVHATAALLLRDPNELVVELFPHLYFPKDTA